MVSPKISGFYELVIKNLDTFKFLEQFNEEIQLDLINRRIIIKLKEYTNIDLPKIIGTLKISDDFILECKRFYPYKQIPEVKEQCGSTLQFSKLDSIKHSMIENINNNSICQHVLDFTFNCLEFKDPN